MAVFATIAFATLLLEDDYLLTLYEGLENLANHLRALYCGGTYFYCIVGFSEEHTVKFNCVTFFVSIAEIVNIQELLRLCLELLSLDFYDSVHLLFCCITGYTFGRTAAMLTCGCCLDMPGEAKSDAKLAI